MSGAATYREVVIQVFELGKRTTKVVVVVDGKPSHSKWFYTSDGEAPYESYRRAMEWARWQQSEYADTSHAVVIEQVEQVYKEE